MLNVNALDGIRMVFRGSPKYVTLDLSGSTFTSIGDNAFNQCYGLTSITIPDSVTSIERWAFYGCTNLASVTFQGTISANNLGDTWNSPFEGDLKGQYLAGGIGTYKTTTPVPATETWYPTWTKQ